MHPRMGGALLRPYRSTQYTPTGAGTLRPKQDRGKPAHSALSAYRGFRPSVKTPGAGGKHRRRAFFTSYTSSGFPRSHPPQY